MTKHEIEDTFLKKCYQMLFAQHRSSWRQYYMAQIEMKISHAITVVKCNNQKMESFVEFARCEKRNPYFKC